MNYEEGNTYKVYDGKMTKVNLVDYENKNSYIDLGAKNHYIR